MIALAKFCREYNLKFFIFPSEDGRDGIVCIFYNPVNHMYFRQILDQSILNRIESIHEWEDVFLYRAAKELKLDV